MVDENNFAEIRSQKSESKADVVKNFFGSSKGKIGLGIVLILFFTYAVLSGSDEDLELQNTGVPLHLPQNLSMGSNDDMPLLGVYVEQKSNVTESTPPTSSVSIGKQLIAGPKIYRQIIKLDVVDGATCDAILVTGAKLGPVKARLLTELRSQYGERLLPSDTSILGTAQANGDRLTIRFVKAVLPDGDIVKIAGEALDKDDKSPGIRGSFVTREGMLLAGSVGLNVLSGVADGLQENESVGLGIAKKSNPKNALLNGTSRASLDQAKELTQSFRESSKNIVVAAGTKISVLFGEDSSGGE